jgi:hypothetical protein
MLLADEKIHGSDGGRVYKTTLTQLKKPNPRLKKTMSFLALFLK